MSSFAPPDPYDCQDCDNNARAVWTIKILNYTYYHKKRYGTDVFASKPYRFLSAFWPVDYFTLATTSAVRSTPPKSTAPASTTV